MDSMIDLNQLEAHKDMTSDDDRWRQALIVTELSRSGLSQRAIARGWINPKTGRPYTHRHVQIVLKIVADYSELRPRPIFREVYYKIANRIENS